MLAHILAALAVIAFVVAGLEVLLSSQQKEQLTALVLRAWDCLDRWKRTQWMKWFNSNRTQMVVAIAALLLTAGAILWMHHTAALSSEEKLHQGPLWVVAFLSIGSIISLIQVTFRAQTLSSAIIRSIVLLLVLSLPLIGVLGLAMFQKEVLIPAGHVTLVQALWLIIFVLSSLFTLPLALVWLLVTAPLIVASILQAMLMSGEFLLRRSLEYPRGPIVAVSLLTGATAALLKALM